MLLFGFCFFFQRLIISKASVDPTKHFVLFYSPSQSSGHHMPGKNIPNPSQLCLQLQGAFGGSFLRISLRLPSFPLLPLNSHGCHVPCVNAVHTHSLQKFKQSQKQLQPKTQPTNLLLLPWRTIRQHRLCVQENLWIPRVKASKGNTLAIYRWKSCYFPGEVQKISAATMKWLLTPFSCCIMGNGCKSKFGFYKGTETPFPTY